MKTDFRSNGVSVFKQVIRTSGAFMMAGAIPVALNLLAPAAYAATSPCGDDEVTVIVEGFGVGCAPPGGNGYDTLRAAGFDVEVTQKFPDFVCRINGSPGVDVDKCLTASPSDGYWAYWHAPLGASDWTYSNNGAFTRTPEAGTVDAWMWGAGEKPGAVPLGQSQAVTERQSALPENNSDNDNPPTAGGSEDSAGLGGSANTKKENTTINAGQQQDSPTDGGGSPLWTTLLAIAAIVLVGIASAITWWIRKQEVNGQS